VLSFQGGALFLNCCLLLVKFELNLSLRAFHPAIDSAGKDENYLQAAALRVKGKLDISLVPWLAERPLFAGISRHGLEGQWSRHKSQFAQQT
jgi:hypothetical protein